METKVAAAALAPVPAHVPGSLVRDFDMFAIPRNGADAITSMAQLHKDHPDIFWTPRNGGHWVATRAEHIEAMLRDNHRFSSRRVFLPRDDSVPQAIPLEIDAPLHNELRKPIARALFPKVVEGMASNVRELAVELIENFLDRGECEFVSEFATVMPIYIFLDLIDIPRTDRERLLPLAADFIKGGTAELRASAQQGLFDYVREVVRARRDSPGEDLGSIVVNCTAAGDRIGEDDAIAYMTNTLLAGLDTIASALSYITWFLAENPGHRRQLIERIDDETFVRRAIEELFRRFSIGNSARVVVGDVEVGGVSLRDDDFIVLAMSLAGLDERNHACPMHVDFQRENSNRHLQFGAGPHTCPGATLARREALIFLQEWLRLIPDFGVKPGTEPEQITGVVCSFEKLELVWPAA